MVFRVVSSSTLIFTAIVSFSEAAFSDSSYNTCNAINSSDQLVLSLTGNWGSQDGMVTRFERGADGQLHQVNWKVRENDISTDSAEMKRPYLLDDKTGSVQAISAVVGSNGLGWSQGDQSQVPEYDVSKVVPNCGSAPCPDHIKREGDSRAPAGLFDIGTCFGYHDREDEGVPSDGMPYYEATDDLRCVDHIASEHYNTIVHNNRIRRPRDYNGCITEDCEKKEAKAQGFVSQHGTSNIEAFKEKMGDTVEVMKQDQPLFQTTHPMAYEYGCQIINHAPDGPSVKGGGSCIFLHVQKPLIASKSNPQQKLVPASTGCTAFPKPAMQELISWFKPKAHPKVLQLTLEEYEYHLKAGDWCLPIVANEDRWETQLFAADCNRRAALNLTSIPCPVSKVEPSETDSCPAAGQLQTPPADRPR